MSRLQQKSFRVSYLLEHTNEAGRGGGNSHILLEGFLVDGEVILIKFKRLCEVEAHGGEKYVILGRNTRPLWGGGKEGVDFWAGAVASSMAWMVGAHHASACVERCSCVKTGKEGDKAQIHNPVFSNITSEETQRQCHLAKR